MSISNELSSDLATTLFVSLNDKFNSNPRKLAEIVFDFMSALEPLERSAKRRFSAIEGKDPGSSEGTPAN
jgi:hypothetical protein